MYTIALHESITYFVESANFPTGPFSFPIWYREEIEKDKEEEAEPKEDVEEQWEDLP